MADLNTAEPTQSLYFTELNPDPSKPTILFIHGGGGSHKGWDLVTPHLEHDYHLLLPDLPGHGRSSQIRPFTLADSASRLAELIKSHANGGKAHVVGLSLGMHVAVELISVHPDQILSAFVSGYNRFPNLAPTTLARGFKLDSMLQSIIPKPVISWLMDGIVLTPPDEYERQPDPAMYVEAAVPLCAPDDVWPAPWPAQTLIVCAGKGGLVPSLDQPWAAKKLRDIGRERNAGTTAVIHRGMRHPWSRQDPELWAETTRAWFERGKFPKGKGFEEL